MVAGAELLSEAVAELYASDPEAFTERRAVLAAQARAAGERSAAKEIAGLRKPTRSAWVINQLVRADPSVPSRLAALGDELRAAEAALDGEGIRELSLARRQLIDALLQQALQVPGQAALSAALQEEVAATFGAALADPQVAEQLAAGTLLRAAHWAGFGSGERPALALVPPSAGGRSWQAPTPAGRPAAGPAARPAAGPASGPGAAPAARVGAAPAARAETESQAAKAARKHHQAITDAEEALAKASRAADAAAEAERERQRVLLQIEKQLAEARERLVDARIEARQAERDQRRARQALDRLRR
jgi:hypothetical protein